MKLNKKQLKKLIRESIKESKYYISNPKGGVTPAFSAYEKASYKDKLAANVDPKIADLMQHDDESVRQGRELAHMLADPDSELAKLGPFTPEEEIAYDVLGPQDKEGDQRHTFDIQTPLNDPHLLLTLQSQDKNKLKKLGFTYIADLPYGPDTDYDDWGEQFRFQSKALGCEVEDLAFVDTEYSYDMYKRVVDMIKSSGEEPIPIPGDTGYFGHNNLYDLNGVKILTTGQMGGYYTIKICGK